MTWQADISVWLEKPSAIQVFSDDGQEQDYVPERTCKDVTSEEHTQAFTCSECGCWVAYDEYWETGIYVDVEWQAVHIHPRYCPNCGAKVVE